MNYDKLSLIQNSAFFESFKPEHQEYLARHSSIEQYSEGDFIIREFDLADTLYMLISGRVQLTFHSTKDGSLRAGQAEKDSTPLVPLRTISEPGYIIGWSSMVEPFRNRASVIALSTTHVTAFERNDLESYVKERPDFGVALMKRILWLVGRRLRETRIRYVARLYENEILTIRALVDQNRDLLSDESPLHKIPHYLENRLTFSDAFHTLVLLRSEGDELERNLAVLCLEVLEKVRNDLSKAEA